MTVTDGQNFESFAIYVNGPHALTVDSCHYWMLIHQASGSKSTYIQRTHIDLLSNRENIIASGFLNCSAFFFSDQHLGE